MDHTIAIAYLSGTGNTWKVADQYRQAFATLGRTVTLLPIESLATPESREALAEYEVLGLGFPVHCWNTPRFVARFIDDLPRSAGQPMFLFATAQYGVGGAFDWARDHLGRRGYAVLHEARYYTGCDYYFSAPARALTEREIAKKFDWLRIDVKEAAIEITHGHERHIYAGDTARWLLSGVAWRLYRLGCLQMHRLLSADERCTRCGLCAATCPTDNIRVIETGVTFDKRCTACLRCLSVCPVQAIQLTRWTRTIGRYLAPGYAEVIRRAGRNQRRLEADRVDRDDAPSQPTEPGK